MYVGDDDPNRVPAMTNLIAVKKLSARLRKGKDSRRQKIQRVRRSIDAGQYDNALKLSIAMDRMLEDVFGR
jgi:hypothetical protein